jgi:hypothetical protein
MNNLRHLLSEDAGLFSEDTGDALERIAAQLARQTRLLEHICELLAAQAQRTASTRNSRGETEARIQPTMGEPHTSMRRSPGSGSS